MLKVGDRVYPVHRMSDTGTIVEIRQVQTKTWMVGGSPSSTTIVVVEHDKKGVLKSYKTSDLFRADT